MRWYKKLTSHSKAMLVTFFCLATSVNFAQHVEIDRIDIRGNKVIVWYILNDPNDSHKYSINLYSSLDKFSSPLTKVSGDVGVDVKPGHDNRIIWDISNEVGNFKGSLVLEVRGNVVEPFVQLTAYDVKRSFKRGKNYPITWRSGNLAGQVNIQLYNKEDQLVWEANDLPNSGKYDWSVPRTIKKGSDYRLKFTNAKDANDFLYSAMFTIRPQTSMLVKIGGAVVILGGGVALLSGGKGSNSSSNNLANPPLPPGN